MPCDTESSLFPQGDGSLQSLIFDVVDDKNRRLRKYRPSPHPFVNEDAETPNLSENSDSVIQPKRPKLSVPALEGIVEGWNEEPTPVKTGGKRCNKTQSSPLGIPMPVEILDCEDMSLVGRVHKGTPRKSGVKSAGTAESPMTRARRKEQGEENFMELLPPTRKRQPTPAIRKARHMFGSSPDGGASRAQFGSPTSDCALETIDLTVDNSVDSSMEMVAKEQQFDGLDDSFLHQQEDEEAQIDDLDSSSMVAESVNHSVVDEYECEFGELAQGMLNEWHELSLGVCLPSSRQEPVFPPALLPPRFHRDQPKQVRWANVSVAEFDLWPDWGKVPCIDDEFYAVGLSPYLTSAYLRTIDDYEEWKDTRGAVAAVSIEMKLRKYYWYRCYADMEAYRSAIEQDLDEKVLESAVSEAVPTSSISGLYVKHGRVLLRGIWGVVSDEGNTVLFDQYTPGRLDTSDEIAEKLQFVEYQCYQARNDPNEQSKVPSLDQDDLRSFYTVQCTNKTTRSIYADMCSYLETCERNDWSSFNDIVDLESQRLGRQGIGCQCVHEHGDCIEHCECEQYEISCLGDVCGCSADGCTNAYGRFYYDDAKVAEFTRRVAKQANKYIYAFQQWEQNPSLGERPCDYGIPPIRADALRIKLMRLLPPSLSRIPECNTIHVLPPQNLMSWQKDDVFCE